MYDGVPEELLPAYIRRLVTRYVETGGTLILGAYGSSSKQEPARISPQTSRPGVPCGWVVVARGIACSKGGMAQGQQGHGADAQERAAHARR